MKAMCLGASRVLVNPVRLLTSINKSLLLSLIIVTGLLPQQLLAEDVAGFIPGEFTVSSGGAAKYNIPIEVPPGTASMQPNLSLKYNSQAKNGLLGVGWSLAGLSSISRCQATEAQDGFNGGINLDGDDRFCLDGRRLVAINGAVGVDGTEYRTEIDSFAKIVSYGQSGNGPAYWKVWTKSGRIIEYGNTDDSSLDAQANDSILRWSVNKISDVVGNYLTVTYSEDSTVGEIRPERIDYAANNSMGTTPDLSVQFGYEDRTDVIRKYVAGSINTTSKRLASIKTYVNAGLVKEYRLVYEYGTATKRSRIKDITECDDQNCKPATTLSWQDRSINSFEGISHTNDYGENFEADPAKAEPTQFGIGDYNGDGVADLFRLYVYEQWLTTYLTKHDGTFEAAVAQQTPKDYRFSRSLAPAGDFNGDGVADFYLYNYEALNVFLSGVDGTFESRVKYVPGTHFDRYFQTTLDINGDGFSDVVGMKVQLVSGKWKPVNSIVTHISKGDGTFDNVLHSISTSIGGFVWNRSDHAYYKKLVPGDFNGDGRMDFVTFSGGGDRLLVFISKGDGTYGEIQTTTKKSYRSFGHVGRIIHIYPGDFNGDGVTDLLGVASNSSGLLTFFGKGDGTFDEIFMPYTDLSLCDSTRIVVDVNGDGRSDMLCQGKVIMNTYLSSYQDNPEDKTFISKGDGTYTTYKNLLGSGVALDLAGDFNGDGQGDILSIANLIGSTNKKNGYYKTALSDTTQSIPDLLISITDGLGDKTQITYKPLTDNSIYTKGTDAGPSGTEKDLQVAAYVVAQVDSDDGIGGQNSTTYKYGGLKANFKGRGSLGFAWREETDQQTGIVQRTEYRQDFPYIGRMARTEVRHSDGTLLSEATPTLAEIITHDPASGPDVHFPYISQLIEKKYELNNGELVSTITTSKTYDDYGNPTQIGVVVAGAPWDENKTTVNSYSNDESSWQIGKITQTTVTYSNLQGTEVRSATYAYYGNGLLKQEIIEPNDTELRQQTDYDYDGFGNQSVVTLSGADVESRTSTTVYDSRGRYPVSLTNALGHSETYTYDAGFGVMTSLTGPNSLTTSWDYDGFGNKIREDRADGTWTTITLGQCGVTACPEDAPQGTSLYTTTESAGSPPEVVFYDKKNREIRKVSTGFDGTLAYEDIEYNALGQISGSSQPYYKGEARYWIRYAYDDVNRMISKANPTKSEPDPDPVNGANTTSFSYNGLTVTETNSLNQTTIRLRDQVDNLYKVTDNDGNVTTYLHSPTGNLLSTTDPAGNQVTIGYNARGWKTSMNDPDMGARSYQYNVYGELVAQTDAKDQTISMVYDKLGRMVQRTETKAPAVSSTAPSAPVLSIMVQGAMAPEITTWTYDTAENGIGRLAQVAAPEGYIQTITYDSLGRAKTTSSTIDSKTFSISTDYDEFGRVLRTTRPENFIVENSYNAQGYLNAVYSPTAQIGDYDASHIRFLLDTAINDAETALTKAQEVADAALYYQQKSEEYLLLSGTPELDADLETKLQSIAAELDAASDILNTQADSYLDLAEQLTEVAEQLYARKQTLLQRYAYSGENGNISHYQSMVNDSGNVYFWRAKSRDAAGRLTSNIVGNGLETQDIYNQATGQLTDIISGFGYAAPIRKLGYEYDSLNNVTSRVDQVQGLSESFEYDTLNRLTRSSVSGTIFDVGYDYNIDYGYDVTGNLTYKSDVGNYTYGSQSRTNGNAGPHALLSAGADHTGYQYDLNGNMLQGGGRSIAWSIFDKPIKFSKNGSVKASFKYGPERFRYLKVTPESRTYYLGKAYERIESKLAPAGPGKVEHKYFIYADGQLVGIHVKAVDSGDTLPDETRYLHRDSLGSIDTITDGQGRIIDRMSYNPFGSRRGGDWRVNTGEPLVPVLTNRGFTGHEHVDEMDLIHMNGRVYDPELGRFISADPLIQFPYDPQSYNRYSYVLNNPLKYTDPSGYSVAGDCDPMVWDPLDDNIWGTLLGGFFDSGSSLGIGSSDSLGFGLENNYVDENGLRRHASFTGTVRIVEKYVSSPGSDSSTNSNIGSSGNNNKHTGNANKHTGIGGYGYLGVAGESGSWSSMAHNALDAAGWVPGFGSIASVVDSAIYAYEGDWVTAGFVFAGVLGPAGKAFGKFGRVAKSGNLGAYFPKRTLPTDKRGVPIPDSPYPHSQLGRSKPKYGSEPQAREWGYGSNGNLQPQRDIDFTDHGFPSAHPHVPHQHKLTPNNPKLAPKGGYQREKGGGRPL